MHRGLSIVLAAFALIFPAPTFAGTLCGTVRDASTNATVPRAGLFLRTPSGSYTGYATATDVLGHYCFDGIPAGFYDLEVRVDHYVTAWVRNIEVKESVSGVDVDLVGSLLLLPPYPNPAFDRVRIAFRLPEESVARLTVTDVQGRLVQGWESASLPAGTHDLTWDLKDRIGRPVKAGRYYVRLTAANIQLVRSFVHLAR